MQRTTFRGARLVVAGAITSLALTGCGVDQLAQEGAEQAVEEAIEQGASGDVDLDVDGEGGFKVESSDGAFQVGAGEVPATFPADEVPLIDGEVLSGTHIADQDVEGWSVNLEVEGPARDRFDAAVAALESAGFEPTEMHNSEAMQGRLEGNGFRVMTIVMDGGDTDPSLISYNVTVLPE